MMPMAHSRNDHLLRGSITLAAARNDNSAPIDICLMQLQDGTQSGPGLPTDITPMTVEQQIDLVLLQYRSANHPGVRQYDREVVDDRLAYLMANGLIERRYGKSIRNHPAPSTIALSPAGKQRREELQRIQDAVGDGYSRNDGDR
jgi:hypothetical protein